MQFDLEILEVIVTLKILKSLPMETSHSRYKYSLLLQPIKPHESVHFTPENKNRCVSFYYPKLCFHTERNLIISYSALWPFGKQMLRDALTSYSSDRM